MALKAVSLYHTLSDDTLRIVESPPLAPKSLLIPASLSVLPGFLLLGAGKELPPRYVIKLIRLLQHLGGVVEVKTN